MHFRTTNTIAVLEAFQTSNRIVGTLSISSFKIYLFSINASSLTLSPGGTVLYPPLTRIKGKEVDLPNIIGRKKDVFPGMKGDIPDRAGSPIAKPRIYIRTGSILSTTINV